MDSWFFMLLLPGRRLGLLFAQNSHMLPNHRFTVSILHRVKKLKRVLEAETRHLGLAQVMPRRSHLVERPCLRFSIIQNL